MSHITREEVELILAKLKEETEVYPSPETMSNHSARYALIIALENYIERYF